MSNSGPDIKAIYSRRLLYQRLVFVALAITIGAFVVLDESPDQTLFGLPSLAVVALSGVVIVGALYVTFRYWRCPACNKMLSADNTLLGVAQCSKCGAKFK